jgi:hypothetical protein
VNRALLLSAALGACLMAAGCKSAPARMPAWIQGAPSSTIFAISGNLGWIAPQPFFHAALDRAPMAEQAVNAFIKQARIDPSKEAGRLSFFLLGGPNPTGEFLFAFSEFRNPKAIMAAVSEAFPPAGSIVVGDHEYPLHAVLDAGNLKIRAILDDRSRVWLGDAKTLSALRSASPRESVASAVAWTSQRATMQGFSIPASWAGRNHEGFRRGLPVGVEAAAFSASLAPGRSDLYVFEMTLAGNPQGVGEALPWVQRLLAEASGLQSAGGVPMSEMHQERGRLAIRCPMNPGQVGKAIARLGGNVNDFAAPR